MADERRADPLSRADVPQEDGAVRPGCRDDAPGGREGDPDRLVAVRGQRIAAGPVGVGRVEEPYGAVGTCRGRTPLVLTSVRRRTRTVGLDPSVRAGGSGGGAIGGMTNMPPDTDPDSEPPFLSLHTAVVLIGALLIGFTVGGLSCLGGTPAALAVLAAAGGAVTVLRGVIR
ncbi:hypothetical protein AB0I68_34130 [Streptomyces sp. NPDC050448]|uniref:hypothetical protein n=1 Tax=Streptomyces sp. NPDC050448 TaxID=3155404 RepID=UPI00341BD4A3